MNTQFNYPKQLHSGVDIVTAKWLYPRNKYISMLAMVSSLALLFLLTWHVGQMVSGELREDGSSVQGHVAQYLAGGLSLIFAYRIVYFYVKRALVVDFLLLLYVATAVIGARSIGLESFAPVLRLVIFFYCIPYLISFAGYLRKSGIVFLVFTILAVWVIVFEVLIQKGLTRDTIGGTGGAQIALGYLTIGFLGYLGTNGALVKKILLLVMLAGVATAIALSASRQGMVGAVLFILIVSLTNRVSVSRFILICGFVLALLAVIFWIGETYTLPVERLFNYDEQTLASRLERYSYFWQVFTSQFDERLFWGADVIPEGELRFVGGIWIGGAGHNIYLVNAVNYGICSSIVLLIFHVLVFRRCFSVYIRSMKNPFVVVGFAYVSVVLMIAQLENFLFYVANIPAYLFYICCGVFVNITRYKGTKTNVQVKMDGD